MIANRDGGAAIRFTMGSFAYVIAIGVALLSPQAALTISAFVAIYYAFERTPAQPAVGKPEQVP